MNAERLEISLKRCFPRGLTGLIFDCDGVLINSFEANRSYYNRLLQEFGYPPMTEEQAAYTQMSTAYQALEHIFPPEEMPELLYVAEHKILYSEYALPRLELEEGVVSCLRSLHAMGIRLGIHTNRSSGMWDVLDRFSLRDLFDPVMTVERVRPKPDPDGVIQTLALWGAEGACVGFIGDSPTDMAAACGGGTVRIAYRRSDLNADVHFDSYAVFQDAVQNLSVLKTNSEPR